MARVGMKAFEKERDGVAPSVVTKGQCLCGAVQVEIGLPAFWAWHDHSRSLPIAARGAT